MISPRRSISCCCVPCPSPPVEPRVRAQLWGDSPERHHLTVSAVRQSLTTRRRTLLQPRDDTAESRHQVAVATDETFTTTTCRGSWAKPGPVNDTERRYDLDESPV